MLINIKLLTFRDIKLGLMELETTYLPVWKYCAEVAQRKNEENKPFIDDFIDRIIFIICIYRKLCS